VEAVAVRAQKRSQMGDLNVAQGDAPLVIVSASYRFSRWPVSRPIVRIDGGFLSANCEACGVHSDKPLVDAITDE